MILPAIEIAWYQVEDHTAHIQRSGCLLHIIKAQNGIVSANKAATRKWPHGVSVNKGEIVDGEGSSDLYLHHILSVHPSIYPQASFYSEQSQPIRLTSLAEICEVGDTVISKTYLTGGILVQWLGAEHLSPTPTHDGQQ